MLHVTARPRESGAPDWMPAFAGMNGGNGLPILLNDSMGCACPLN